MSNSGIRILAYKIKGFISIDTTALENLHEFAEFAAFAEFDEFAVVTMSSMCCLPIIVSWGRLRLHLQRRLPSLRCLLRLFRLLNLLTLLIVRCLSLQCANGVWWPLLIQLKHSRHMIILREWLNRFSYSDVKAVLQPRGPSLSPQRSHPDTNCQ